MSKSAAILKNPPHPYIQARCLYNNLFLLLKRPYLGHQEQHAAYMWLEYLDESQLHHLDLYLIYYIHFHTELCLVPYERQQHMSSSESSSASNVENGTKHFQQCLLVGPLTQGGLFLTSGTVSKVSNRSYIYINEWQNICQ